jgi:hypothetical protein
MNITQTARQYMRQNPGLKRALHRGLLNYSAVAREIIKKTNLQKANFDATVVALRRLHYSMRKQVQQESKIIKLLRESTLEIHSNIVVFIISKGHYWDMIESIHKKAKRYNHTFRIIEGVNAVTIITLDKYEGELREILRNKTKKVNTDLIEVTIRSPDYLEDTPGVMGFLYSLLAEHHINIVETMSCWTETIFVFDKKDIAKVTGLLSF